MDEYKPDFKKIYTIANEVLVSSHTIMDIPFSLKLFIKEETDIALCTYQKVILKSNEEDISFGSEDAVLSEKDGMYIIFYNNQAFIKRKIWSIAHELGHFYAGHDLKAAEKCKALYDVQEVEANFFAAQFLMPDQLIVDLSKRGCDITNYFLQDKFKVSGAAAEKRLKTLRKVIDYKECFPDQDFNEAIRLKFKDFLDRTAPYKKRYGSSLEEEEEMQKERDTWLNNRNQNSRSKY